MATLESAIPIISQYISSSSSSSSSSKLSFRTLPSAIKLRISSSSPLLSLNPTTAVSPLPLFLTNPSRNRGGGGRFGSAVQEVSLEEASEENQDVNQKRKLYIFNLPWSFSVVDIKEQFGQCGTVTDVEIIKQKNGRSRGFAFVTMASPDEAQAAIQKFDSQEISGRVIKVEFAKRLKKPPPPKPPGPPPGETVHKLYVSNLAWKARSTNLREFFSENFNPIAARVVFDSPSGKSAGYGFVSFATREEAETALSSLEGKELMGRPLRLKFSERSVVKSETPTEDTVESQPEESQIPSDSTSD
ncbi:29 kDa ribonucleoprotein A, chloroplastic [Cucurbita pepo subsp. pepo]|uniref:29 kDa ribonucleoprotein A, chloroplastic n=1 Tax=Cucurbita pepo subsp. pepo TaxID=3664 RepID=UPI000C9D9C3F|nr:29 kDa ribonucleoprotein A, chloroplastic [Cucurbita pepo subsp. pepo]